MLFDWTTLSSARDVCKQDGVAEVTVVGVGIL